MTHEPGSAAEVQDLVPRSASVTVIGGGTKSDAAAASSGTAVLSLARLRGIIDYSQEECVFTARAGTPISEIDSTLAHHRQYLPFDPPFAAEGATLGGTVAAGLSGSRRYRYGGVRDFVIGVRVVDGEGRHIRSGGKVVKNAAGFLLHHALVGSAGAFGVLTEVTVKVFPAPEARRYLAADCGRVQRAFHLARHIESLGADCEAIDFDHQGRLTVAIAGRKAALDIRVERLQSALRSHVRDIEVLDEVAATAMSVPAVSSVKVAGATRAWEPLRPHVLAARFMCAGAVAWLFTSDVAAFDEALDAERLRGVVIRGPGAGRRVGHWPTDVFEERLRSVLDPGNRFSAASHPRR